MTRARKVQVSLSDTPYYHLISRCVRRAFLCGKLGKKSFEHRRAWLVDRIEFLASTFSIRVCSYAIMSNHYHLVIKVESTKDWADKQVLITWASLYQLPMLCERFMQDETMCKAELRVVHQLIAKYRARLMDLSWFIRIIHEGLRENSFQTNFFEMLE